MLPRLVIHLGSTYTRAFLFSSNGQKYHLIETQKELALKDPSLSVEQFKAKYLGRFEEVQVISSLKYSSGGFLEEEVFAEASELFSKLGDILVIDIGSRKTAFASGRFGKVRIGEINLGLGVSAGKILHQASVEDLATLIPYAVDLINLQNYLGKKILYPGFIPFAPEELAIEVSHAAFILAEVKKVVATKFLRNESRFILLTGEVFGSAPSLSLALFPFLQGWQPTGVTQVFVDPGGFFYSFYLLNDFEGMLSQFKKVGTLISLTHTREKGEVLGDCSLDLGLNEKLKFEILAGELIRVPFREGGSGTLEISLKKGVFLGKNFAAKQEIDGGELGIVIDARGRPLPKPPLSKEGREKVRDWLEALGGKILC